MTGALPGKPRTSRAKARSTDWRRLNRPAAATTRKTTITTTTPTTTTTTTTTTTNARALLTFMLTSLPVLLLLNGFHLPSTSWWRDGKLALRVRHRTTVIDTTTSKFDVESRTKLQRRTADNRVLSFVLSKLFSQISRDLVSFLVLFVNFQFYMAYTLTLSKCIKCPRQGTIME